MLNISVGSGATLATDQIASIHYSQGKIVDGTVGSTNAWIIDSTGAGRTQQGHLTSLASGQMIGINPSSNFIGLVSAASIQGKVDANITNASIPVTESGNWDVRSLLSLASIYGQVNVTNTVPVTGTFWQTTQPVSFNQLVSLASGTNVGLNPSSNFIGLVSLASINGNVNVTNTVPVTGTFWQTTQPVSFNQLVSLASGTNVLTSFSGLISLASGQYIGLNPSSNFIGLVSTASIQGNVHIVDASIPVTESGSWVAGVTGLLSLASGTNVGLNPSSNWIGLVSLASIQGSITSTFGGVISLASGQYIGLNPSSNYIGLATVVLNSNVTLSPIQSLLSLASIYGQVGITGAIPAGANYIGLATVVLNSNVTLSPIQSLLSLASIYGNVGLAAGSNYVGLASVVPAYTPISANYTSFATYMSASGNATLIVPPSSNRWILKDLIIGSLGRAEVQLLSGAGVKIPYTALATTGGYIGDFGDSGLRANALNDSLVIGLNTSGATISVMANVRFDST